MDERQERQAEANERCIERYVGDRVRCARLAEKADGVP
jgi:hypothetical protein